MDAVETQLVEVPDHEIALRELDLVIDIVLFLWTLPVDQVIGQLAKIEHLLLQRLALFDSRKLIY